MKNNKVKNKWFSSVSGVSTVLVSWITICMLWSTSAFSLGVGAASTESYIGEKLSVHIPLFNVVSPNDLSVIIQPSQNGNLFGNNSLSAELENKQSQLGVRVTSEKITAEPFVSFVVDVIDAGSVTSKEFSVLLDLAPNGRISPSRRINVSNTSPAQNNVNLNESAAYINTNSSSNNRSGRVMGPYDWAVAGQVPDEFGPVIDGQSLWRVARRINKSLDVSIDQMMWSLYQNNRDKFATNSITSLKAGSFLRIPTAQQASAISELAAVRNIKQNISSGGTSAPPVDSNSTAAVKSSEQKSDSASPTKSAESEQASFDLTGLNLSQKFNDKISGIDSKAQQIIASLAESVGNLTQELIKKDRKIAFLEEKVAALEAYAKVSAEDLNIQTPELDGLIELEGQLIDQAADNEKEVSSASDEATQTPIVSNAEEDVVKPEPIVKQIEVQPIVNKESHVDSGWWSGVKWWHILLAVLGLFLLVIFLLRDWILNLFHSLNLFEKENEIEFENSEFEPVQPEVAKQVIEEIDPDLTVENKTKLNGLSHKSILDSINSRPEVDLDDALSPQTVIDLEGDYAYTEVYSDLEFIEEDQGEASLPFVERFDKAIKSQDFGFALQLLNMARGNEIDDEEYHFQRLRMYEQMHDENAFYDYFCEIENHIPRFKPEIQKQISHLVLEMAQQ